MKQIWMIVGAVVALVVAGLIASYSIQISGDVRDDLGDDYCATLFNSNVWNSTAQVCQNSTGGNQTGPNEATNGSIDTITGISNVTSKLPSLGTIVIAVVIIAVLIAGFAYFKNR